MGTYDLDIIPRILLFCFLNLYRVIFPSLFLSFFFFHPLPFVFQINFPTHTLPESVCTRSIKQSVTQIDVERFGKFKRSANYTKVGKHTHMKHLFVGAGNLSGGLSRVQTSILTTLPSSPPRSRRSVRRLSQSFTTLPPPLYLWNALSNTNKQCTTVLQGSLLLSLVTK